MKWNYLVLKVLGRTTGGFVNGGLKKFGIFEYFGTDGFDFGGFAGRTSSIQVNLKFDYYPSCYILCYIIWV